MKGRKREGRKKERKKKKESKGGKNDGKNAVTEDGNKEEITQNRSTRSTDT